MCQGGIPKYPNKRHYRKRRGVGTRHTNYQSWGVGCLTLSIHRKDDDGPTQWEHGWRPTLTWTWGLLGMDSHADRPRVFTWHANDARQNNKEVVVVWRRGQVSVWSKGSRIAWRGFPRLRCAKRLLPTHYPSTVLLFLSFSWTCRQIRWTIERMGVIP